MTIDCAFYGTIHRCEAKTSANGKQYLRLSVRCGEGDAAQWVSVMSFDPEAFAAADKFVKDAKVYVEGRLSLSEWEGRDGDKKHGLSVMSWFCRLPQIGKNRPKRDRQGSDKQEPAPQSTGAPENSFYSDEIPF
jgi:single-stranded DNA-binding protein